MRFGFGLSGFGFNAATGNNRLSSGSAPAPELNPDASFALGSGGWTPGGATVVVNTGNVVYTAAPNSVAGGCVPSGANQTAFNASVPDSTPGLVVRVTVSAYTAGDLLVNLKSGGNSAPFGITGPGTYTITTTSGTGVALGNSTLRSAAVGTTLTVTAWSIKIA